MNKSIDAKAKRTVKDTLFRHLFSYNKEIAFERPDYSGEFEWTATVLNINAGHNEKIVKACETLHGYATLIDKIRDYKKLYTNEKAVEFAINDCIKAGILADYLTKCRNEAISMALTTFNQERYEEYLKEDYIEMGYEKGVEEGIEKGIEKGINAMVAMIKEGKVTLTDAAFMLDVPEDRIRKYLE